MSGKAEVGFSCGRHYLKVSGIILAMEGDPCRDGGLPEDVYEPIPEAELSSATIGGKPSSEIPLKLVRFFRGDRWTEKMLEYAASRINGQED